MRALLSPSAYRDNQVFAEESKDLFHRSWQLAGFAREIRNHNDYITVELNSKSVVIQNFNGKIRGFVNVCSHRQSRIRREPCGNGPLRCPYHGWTYDEEGLPVGIPGRQAFDANDLEDLNALRLPPVAAETCGELVFARLADEGDSLRDFLGDAWTSVHTIGSSLGEQLSRYHLTIEANWKVVVENTLEAYHVNFVHAQSLKRLGVSGTRFEFQGPHSTYFSDTAVGKSGPSRDRLNEAFSSRPFKTEGYIHQLVFPTTTIATAHGTTFNVNLIRPVGVTTTEVTVYMFETILGELTRPQLALVRAMRPSVVDLTNTTFDEDKVICEQVQNGLRDAERTAILGEEERRIERFQLAYVESMRRGALR